MVVSIDNPTANRRPAAREIDKVFFMVASGERELRDQGLGWDPVWMGRVWEPEPELEPERVSGFGWGQ